MLSYVARMIQGALEQQVFKIKFAFPLPPLGRQKVFSKNFLCLAPMSYTLGMDLVYWTIRMPRLTPFHERRPSICGHWPNLELRLVIGSYKVSKDRASFTATWC